MAIRRPAGTEIVDLSTCRTRTAPGGRPVFTLPSGVRIRVTTSAQSIVYRGRTLYTVRENHSWIPAGAPGPLVVEGISPDRKWIVFAIDPQGSASLMADGLQMEVLSTRTGRVRSLAPMLAYPDYLAWCNGRLVVTAGGDRIAAHGKRLVVAEPPDFKLRQLVVAPRFSFGSLACYRRGGVVVQAARASTTAMNPRWELWRLGLEGGMSLLDRPPPGSSDDSPRATADGKVVFVRSCAGNGTLYALGIGPLVAVGRDEGYYGHRPWAGVTWSLQR